MDALGYASDRAVRAILTAICDDAWVKSKALDYLRIIEPQAFEQAKLEVLNPGFKRKAHVGLSICVQCKEPFDEQDNRRRDCKYHSGELVVDYEDDFWADHDENCHGTIDTKEMREEYPDGFTWDCCQRSGDEPGCRQGQHQSNPELSKKGAGESESEAGDAESSEADEDGEDEEEGS